MMRLRDVAPPQQSHRQVRPHRRRRHNGTTPTLVWIGVWITIAMMASKTKHRSPSFLRQDLFCHSFSILLLPSHSVPTRTATTTTRTATSALLVVPNSHNRHPSLSASPKLRHRVLLLLYTASNDRPDESDLHNRESNNGELSDHVTSNLNSNTTATTNNSNNTAADDDAADDAAETSPIASMDSIMMNDNDSNNYNKNDGSNNITVLRNTSNKKKSTKEYKIIDNRDALPFQIQLHTPPDYHNTATATALLPTDTTTSKNPTHTKRSVDNNKNNNNNKKSSSSDTKTTTTMLSSVYRSNEGNDGDTNNKSSSHDNNKKKSNKKRKNDTNNDNDALLLQKLGDYVLDATTTTGDTIIIQDMVYRVIRHRCLYQYKQKQFVMCRKILEVKELNRYLSEQYIIHQFNL